MYLVLKWLVLSTFWFHAQLLLSVKYFFHGALFVGLKLDKLHLILFTFPLKEKEENVNFGIYTCKIPLLHTTASK